MTAIQLTLMTVDEARATVDQIKVSLANVRALLFELREREGWRALGYATWQACIQAEFHMSEQRAYQLLSAHVVDRILAPSWQESSAFFGKNATSCGSTIVEPQEVAPIKESQARELAPLIRQPEKLREVYAEVVEQTQGKPTAPDIRVAVERRMGVERSAPPPFVMPEMEHETEEEGAYYALARQRRVVRFDPSTVADAATHPDAALPGFEEFEAWFSSFMARLRANAASPVRAVE